MGFLGSLLHSKTKQQHDPQLDAALTQKNSELAELTTRMRALRPTIADDKVKLDELRGEREKVLATLYDLESKRHGAAYADRHKLLRSKHTS
jgi:hypothetical protein